MLTYPASKPPATVSILEPTDIISYTFYGRFLDKDPLGSSDEGEFPSDGRDPNTAER